MIIYITGASGSGKTTVLKSLPMKGYDLDDIYENNWKKHRKVETVLKGVKKDVSELISKHKDIVFVGAYDPDQIYFTPDVVIILVRTDYEKYYRQKLVRDLKILCDNQNEYNELFMKSPLDEIKLNFKYNEIVNMRSIDEFKAWVLKINNGFKELYPQAKMLQFNEIAPYVKRQV